MSFSEGVYHHLGPLGQLDNHPDLLTHDQRNDRARRIITLVDGAVAKDD